MPGGNTTAFLRRAAIHNPEGFPLSLVFAGSQAKPEIGVILRRTRAQHTEKPVLQHQNEAFAKVLRGFPQLCLGSGDMGPCVSARVSHITTARKCDRDSYEI